TENKFFGKYPELGTFHTDTVVHGASLDELRRRYDQATRNLRLPSARKTLVTAFVMLDITDKTPQKEIDRRIDIINAYLLKQPEIGGYIKAYNEAKLNYAFGLAWVKNRIENLVHDLSELPADFADDIRRRGDALHKAAAILRDFYDNIYFVAAFGGDAL